MPRRARDESSETDHRTRYVLKLFQSPNTLNNQTETTTTTTTFRIDLMLEAMGMKRLTKYSPTPTMISITTIFSKGIFWCSSDRRKAIRGPRANGLPLPTNRTPLASGRSFDQIWSLWNSGAFGRVVRSRLAAILGFRLFEEPVRHGVEPVPKRARARIDGGKGENLWAPKVRDL